MMKRRLMVSLRMKKLSEISYVRCSEYVINFVGRGVYHC